MSTKLKIPIRAEPIIGPDKSPTKRFFQFLNSIPGIADPQTKLTIAFTANAPTAATNQTVADGNSPTSAEIGQFMQNVNTVLSELITELKNSGVIGE